jgi:hypothetical protein
VLLVVRTVCAIMAMTLVLRTTTVFQVLVKTAQLNAMVILVEMVVP